ncbi:MAG TPA: hypothetical protein H9726_03985 [Candidatus Borkfalkia avicola]|uniref:Uncharacterized protein n=1 Tax=Candidatus Borkfalkia avicola TaxID=2838503 RepID=A0A9D2D6X1_9FIRM|nr:hypothetical protein [Candidatus Borkfalkia avicola]
MRVERFATSKTLTGSGVRRRGAEPQANAGFSLKITKFCFVISKQNL